MTTPTKEQIEEVAKVIFITQRDEPVTALQYDGISDYWDRCLRKETKSRYRARAQMAIETWEKIKDVDARVEKMCKNNPGIKDFEDFNKAINSPK